MIGRWKDSKGVRHGLHEGLWCEYRKKTHTPVNIWCPSGDLTEWSRVQMLTQRVFSIKPIDAQGQDWAPRLSKRTQRLHCTSDGHVECACLTSVTSACGPCRNCTHSDLSSRFRLALQLKSVVIYLPSPGQVPAPTPIPRHYARLQHLTFVSIIQGSELPCPCWYPDRAQPAPWPSY